jgi:concanavalin A-like lectin/glucanase superfamily protein
VTSAALTLNTWHHVVATYDGTTLRLYVDGALANSAAASITLAYVGGQPCTIAASTSGTGPVSPASFFAGSIDEVAIYTTAPLLARITAHYNAGNAGTGMGTTSNTLTIPPATRIAFGSPVWGSIQNWSVRFRFTSGANYRFYLHFTDASNHLRARVLGTSLLLEQTIAGVTNTLGTATLALASNVWYWLTVTQFPSAPGGGLRHPGDARHRWPHGGDPGGAVCHGRASADGGRGDGAQWTATDGRGLWNGSADIGRTLQQRPYGQPVRAGGLDLCAGEWQRCRGGRLGAEHGEHLSEWTSDQLWRGKD